MERWKQAGKLECLTKTHWNGEGKRENAKAGGNGWNSSFLGSMALAVALLFLAAATPSFITTAALKDRKLPVYSVQRDDKCVSLTFDAAWGDVQVWQRRIRTNQGRLGSLSGNWPLLSI